MPLIPESQMAFRKAKMPSAAGSDPSLAAAAGQPLSRFEVAHGLNDEAVADAHQIDFTHRSTFARPIAPPECGL
jgi:hypothetical protein